jgi:hypothetical protein
MSTPQMIVPVLMPEDREAVAPAATAAAPHLSFHGGPLLTQVEVFTIFWGAAWAQSPQSELPAQLDQFFDVILTSSLMDQMAEYGVPGRPIGHGHRSGTVTLLRSEPGGGGGQVTDQQIQQALKDFIASGAIPPPTPNTLYFVFLPPGVTSVLDGARSCAPRGFCGYHNHIDQQIFYAVEPFLTCAGCTFGTDVLTSLIKVCSHELCEAVTDPALNAWFDDSPPGNEIGDICNAQVGEVGGFTVQFEWSNQAGACILR